MTQQALSQWYPVPQGKATAWGAEAGAAPTQAESGADAVGALQEELAAATGAVEQGLRDELAQAGAGVER